MTAGTTVRIATWSDVSALEDLRCQWTEEWHGPHVDDGFSERFEGWFNQEAHQRTFWLAERADVAVGMVNLLTFIRMPAPGQEAGAWGYLGNMYVAPGHRSVGIGDQLLAALLTHADAEGLERIVLSPTERSVPFYRRAGFDAANQLLLRPRR